MTGQEWAPGDVAMLSSVNGEAAVGLAVGQGDEVSGWRTEDSRFWGLKYIHLARRLLVLDPGSDDDAHRLIRAFWDHHNDDCDDVQAMREAMRSLVAPKPKPDEPQGLGAVVEDDKGGLFVRTADVDCFKPWSYANNFSDHDYADITAVRILSDGVS